MIGWLYLAFAVCFEVAAATCLKFSNGIPGIDKEARPLPFILMLAFYVTCFLFMSKSLETIQLGVMYAFWAGLGTILVAVVGVYLFQDTMPAIKIAGIGFIIVGVAMVNLGGTKVTPAPTEITTTQH
jgi:small multidrug resistance pump